MSDLSLRALSLAQDVESILSSFSPSASPEQVANATLSLVRLAGLPVGVARTKTEEGGSGSSSSSLARGFEEVEISLEEKLSRGGRQQAEEEELVQEEMVGRLSALRALGVLAAILPEKCEALLGRLLPELLAALQAITQVESPAEQLPTSSSSPTIATWSSAESQLVAQLFSTLSSHAPCRRILSASTDFIHSAYDLVDGAELQHSPATSALARSALAVGLALLKLGNATQSESARGEGGAASIRRKTAGVDEELRTEGVRAEGQTEAEQDFARKEEVELRTSVRALAKAQLMDSLSHQASSLRVQPGVEHGITTAFIEELRHSAHMLALEALAHLATRSDEKLAIMADDELLRTLCSSDLGPIKLLGARRAVFPSRAANDESSTSTNNQQVASTYALDPFGVTSRADGAAVYALSSLFSSLAAYPPMLSAQEKQMLALRYKASGAAPPVEESFDVLHKRMLRLIATGAGQQITRLTIASLSGANKQTDGEKDSSATRIALGLALMGLTTPQDRKARAKLVQDGCARALLSLSSAALPIVRRLTEATSGSSAQDKDALHLAPLQALARLCISLPPQLMFAQAVAPLQPIVALFLSPASNALQRFEACLALTNLASMPELAGTVARCKLEADTATAKPKLGVPASLSVSEALYDRVTSANLMERRAAVELVCNLVQDESVAAHWNGEVEDEKAASSNRPVGDLKVDLSKSAATARMHILLALCAGDSADVIADGEAAAKEAVEARKSALPLRLAASAALAALLSSPSGCKRLLSLRPHSLNILARLLQPGTSGQPPKISALEDEEEEERGLTGSLSAEEEKEVEERDAKCMPHPAGPSGARRDLRTRALACVSCLGQYATWLADTTEPHELTHTKEQLIRSGIASAVLIIGKQLEEVSEEERQMWREIVEHFSKSGVLLDQAVSG